MTTMIGPLQRAHAVASDRIAACCGDVELTYDQTYERCRQLVGAMLDLGLRPGDRVAVVASNCHRSLELYQAIPSAGLVIVPLNQRHTDAELRYALDDAGARVLFTSRELDAVPDCVEHVIDLESGYEALLSSATPADFAADLDERTLAGLFYTGGTTGASKGVMLTHRNLISNALHLQVCWPFGIDARWLVAAPMFHAAGSIAVLATVWHGGRHVILPAVDPSTALDLIESQHITATLLVPTMLAALTEAQVAKPRDVSSVELISHGGSPVAIETLRRAHRAFPDAQLLHLYGATETSPIATTLVHEERLLETSRARSCGQPAIGV